MRLLSRMCLCFYFDCFLYSDKIIGKGTSRNSSTRSVCLLFLLSASLVFQLGNSGVTHSVPTAFIECSGYGLGHAWVTEDEDSPEVLSCVLEQDTISPAYYCISMGRQKIAPT